MSKTMLYSELELRLSELAENDPVMGWLLYVSQDSLDRPSVLVGIALAGKLARKGELKRVIALLEAVDLIPVLT